MVLSPAEALAEGLLDLAARNGLKRVAVIQQDALVPNAITKGASALAKSKGLELVFLETYRTSPEDFSDLLNKVRAARRETGADPSWGGDRRVGWHRNGSRGLVARAAAQRALS